METQIYKNALYYEIAFSFIDATKQSDLFEAFIEKYSEIKVRTVLDLACGTALQLREMSRRGYESYGLDLSDEMLSYLKDRARVEKVDIHTIEASMVIFNLEKKIDFAFIMMGSFIYFRSKEEITAHLNSIAHSLKIGGLYLIENFPKGWPDGKQSEDETWEMEQDGIKVETNYHIEPQDEEKQLLLQRITLKVDDNGQKRQLVDEDILQYVSLEEFKIMIQENGELEFIGLFERDEVKQQENIAADNIVLLRKKR